MAAAERLDLREHIVKGGHAQGHGVGVVNDPRLGRIRLDGLRNLHKHGDGTHCTHQSTRTYRIAYGLIHTHTLRGVHVALHFLEGAGQNGNHHKVNACQCFLQGVSDFILPVAHGLFVVCGLFTNNAILFSCVTVNIIQANRAFHAGIHGQVSHKAPCPATRSAADVGNLQIDGLTVLILHVNSFLSCTGHK